MERWWNFSGKRDLPAPPSCGGSGFGAHGAYHTFKLLELSSDLPMVVEVVETQEKIDSIMPKVDEMIVSGMVTLEKVNVILYTHKHANE